MGLFLEQGTSLASVLTPNHLKFCLHMALGMSGQPSESGDKGLNPDSAFNL